MLNPSHPDLTTVRYRQLGSLVAGTSCFERADVLALLEQQEDGEDAGEADTVINIEGAVGRAASIMDGERRDCPMDAAQHTALRR